MLKNEEDYGYKDGKIVTVDEKVKGYQIALYPGIAYRISDKFSLVAHLGSLGYSSWKYDEKDAKSHTSYGLSLANGTSFGLYFNF